MRVTAGGVSAVSDRGFLVTNSGHDYFINDGSTAGDEYTTAIGNDLNSGKTPDAPMASLAALVRAYALGPGDTVHIDTGTYTLLSDVVLAQGDSGDADASGHRLTFQGRPEQATSQRWIGAMSTATISTSPARTMSRSRT